MLVSFQFQRIDLLNARITQANRGIARSQSGPPAAGGVCNSMREIRYRHAFQFFVGHPDAIKRDSWVFFKGIGEVNVPSVVRPVVPIKEVTLRQLRPSAGPDVEKHECALGTTAIRQSCDIAAVGRPPRGENNPFESGNSLTFRVFKSTIRMPAS